MPVPAHDLVQGPQRHGLTANMEPAVDVAIELRPLPVARRTEVPWRNFRSCRRLICVWTVQVGIRNLWELRPAQVSIGLRLALVVLIEFASFGMMS